MLAESDDLIVTYALRVLSRALFVNGISYGAKFGTSRGYDSMTTDLGRCWFLDQTWICLFACLLRIDVATFAIDSAFDSAAILQQAGVLQHATTIRSEMIPVILALLEDGVRACVQEVENEFFEMMPKMDHHSPSSPLLSKAVPTARVTLICAVLDLCATLVEKVPPFGDMLLRHNVSKTVIPMLYYVSKRRLQHDHSVRQWRDTNASPLCSHHGCKHEKTLSSSPGSETNRGYSRPSIASRGGRRFSSFVIVDKMQPISVELGFESPLGPSSDIDIEPNMQSDIHRQVQRFAVACLKAQLFSEHEFAGFGLFLKAPPTRADDIVAVSTTFLNSSINDIESCLIKDARVLSSSARLANIGRFVLQLGESILEGWFINGALPVLIFIARLFQLVNALPGSSMMDTPGGQGDALLVMRTTFRRLLINWLVAEVETPVLAQTSLFSILPSWSIIWSDHGSAQDLALHACMYLIWQRMLDGDRARQEDAVKLWNIIVTRLPSGMAPLANRTDGHKTIAQHSASLTQASSETNGEWIARHHSEVEQAFAARPENALQQMIREENGASRARADARLDKRENRMEERYKDSATRHLACEEHDKIVRHWVGNIYTSELLNFQRIRQDQDEALARARIAWQSTVVQLTRSRLWSGGDPKCKWQLDEAEGRDRVRMRLVPETLTRDDIYKPKRTNTQAVDSTSTGYVVEMQAKTRELVESVGIHPMPTNGSNRNAAGLLSLDAQAVGDDDDDDFEVIEEPRENQEDYVDKNRRVLQKLERGDQVVGVYNVSRITGLEARECLLVVGKLFVYLVEDLFQRADGEIVSIDDAPQDERDIYTSKLSGTETATPVTGRKTKTVLQSSHWAWEDIVSVSKRRFLFREVAIEVFFIDGRSYLLTLASTETRNQLYRCLADRSEQSTSGSSYTSERTWRAEILPRPRDNVGTFGSKMATVFGSTVTPATRKWIKGELSNFHYLMLINTMAGRTFNDLTQYPVFPWVLADYTSNKLDLTNPKTFRNLSKPMGCQTPLRAHAFKDRYEAFAEMGDGQTPAFHYGTSTLR